MANDAGVEALLSQLTRYRWISGEVCTEPDCAAKHRFAESDVRALLTVALAQWEARWEEQHKAWDDENERRHDAEERLTAALAQVDVNPSVDDLMERLRHPKLRADWPPAEPEYDPFFPVRTSVLRHELSGLLAEVARLSAQGEKDPNA